jgi:hypothetical protein
MSTFLVLDSSTKDSVSGDIPTAWIEDGYYDAKSGCRHSESGSASASTEVNAPLNGTVSYFVVL